MINTDIITTDWQLIAYDQAWKQQEELFETTIRQCLQNEPTQNHLILCEHPHVFTLGKNGSHNNLLINNLQLSEVHAEFVQTNRGGDITYHGPGQLVGYPIFDLSNFSIGLKQYVHMVEEAIIMVVSAYGIHGDRLPGATGVWLDTDIPDKCRKICAIGVRSSHFVTMHGFALNVNTDLNYFSYINPCGFIDKGVTSIAKETQTLIDMTDVKKLTKEAFAKIFDL
jgi:lipoyl(octanoyl) transferase